MEQSVYKVYGYRWVVLLAYMFAVAINQMLWITFAPLTGTAAGYYGVLDLGIGLLSMIFMIVYIFVSLPLKPGICLPEHGERAIMRFALRGVAQSG